MRVARGVQVSVVIAAHNGQSVIKRAVGSVLAQSYRNRELIVVDDGSTDTTASVLRKYGDQIHVIRQENAGALAARNSGAKEAEGEYIAFLDQDDSWTPKKLDTQVRVLDTNPSIGLVFGNLVAADRENKPLGFATIPREYCRSPSLNDLILIFPLYPSSALLRKDLFDRIGGFDTRFGSSGAYGDQDFHIRLRELTAFKFVDTLVGYYFWDEYRPGRIESFLANIGIFAEKYYNHPYLTKSRNHLLRERFVQKCSDHLAYLIKGLLRRNGNVATKELLLLANRYQTQFKSIFGDAYFRIAGMGPLNLDQFVLDETTSTLLFLYLYRRDLRSRFPEVVLGDLSKLHDWAFGVASGIHLDIDHDTLYPLRAYFEEQRGQLAVAPSRTADRLVSHMVGEGVRIGKPACGLTFPRAQKIVNLGSSTRLGSVAARNSLDFIVASNVMGRLGNPLGAFHEWYRYLRPGGYLLLQVADNRFNVDKAKPFTTIRHVFEDWVRTGQAANGKTGGSKHEHVWTDTNFRELVSYVTKYHVPFTVAEFLGTDSQTKCFLCLLEKPLASSIKGKRPAFIRESDFVDALDLISELNRTIREKDELMRGFQLQVHARLLELDAIQRSFGYKAMRFCSSRIDKASPEGTRRGQIRRTAVVSIRVLTEEGLRSFLSKAFRKIRRGEFVVE